MELAFSTNAFTRTSLEVACTAIAAAGYGAVELLADRPHLWPPEIDRGGVAKLRRTLADLGLTVAALNANTAVGYYPAPPDEPLFGPDLCHPDPERRSWRSAFTHRALQVAAELGAGVVTITAGRARPGWSPEAAWPLLVDTVGALATVASELGVRLALEYEPGLLIERASQAVQLFAAVASPALGLNLDVGHAWVVGEEPAAVARALKTARLFHLHLEDIRDRVHYHRIPGEGEIDFAALFAALAEIGYDRAAAVELYTCIDAPEAAARAARAYLRRWFP
ncbi:MAG: xylose isomerase [Nitrospirae bacterium CG18_big_fil_WC_8_21_14_2_50_70_55]|nr:sugar phosphate isomerase/epimerase [Deltaproteobacteria bacterium]OIP64806.1 MAG: hypothetical protein AUK30_05995 [Nitrospirae bacterium CG2_30_70_394]PIQ06610.1 MAG: xylose isomerase [Nitrospirae bacterium CG18_big_fil_WC_8_21_14_2_50_70_55]PIU78554.1 MAG: sugar phosphate isomerase/epimerase [Nitrospirae bacterium CG06_land_8_20_14_3_00_70_43]PIW82867.1 MAG: sugar phosphate isomerase/epimerase [Nitrospirae bacterium CG_4_8_14_3_um_filter_70_85]PIX83457.1 MAG: sugar phosphate isomerase/ep